MNNVPRGASVRIPASVRFAAAVCLLFLLGAGSLFAQKDSRYDSGMNLPFNEKAGEVNPQTGNITLSFTDVSLPGRAGHDFTFGRVWALNRSQVFQAGYNTFAGSNQLSGLTIESQHHLGAGWTSSLPAIVRDRSSGTEILQLFYADGVYELDESGLAVRNEGQSNIVGYDLLNLRVYADSSLAYSDFGGNLGTLQGSYGVADQSADRDHYQLILADNSQYFFRTDGKLMMHQDKSGLNRIWYFYNASGQLAVAVDTINRVIRFSYDGAGNLSTIQWDVESGVKHPDGHRSVETETRSVQYQYQSAASLPQVASLVANVGDYHEPYCLVGVTNPMGQLTRFEYQTGDAWFTYDSNHQHTRNVHLLLTGLREMYDQVSGTYRSGREFTYEVPAKGMYSKYFWGGYLEYYKISQQVLRDRHGRGMQETRYIYQDEGEGGNRNQYSAVVEQGNLRRTYTYLMSSSPEWNHVLSSLQTESRDGFLERTQYTYAADRTKTLDSVFRKGQLVYEEKYAYDKKGNLERHTDRMGLITVTTYDPKYSAPTRQTRTLTSDGTPVDYVREWSLTDKGQVDSATIYIGGSAIQTVKYTYDSWGNPVTVADALRHEVHTDYDLLHHAFPVRQWQTVTQGAWSGGGGVEANWLRAPDSTSADKITGLKAFNSNGSVWLEVDAEGAVVEHYYDALGAEIERVAPDADDPGSWNASQITDFYQEWLIGGGNFTSFFLARENNTGVRQSIDYRNDLVKTYTDLDKAGNAVKVTGVQKDGLGHTEEEIEYGEAGVPHAVKKMTYDTLGRMIALSDPDASVSFVPMRMNGQTVERHDSTWVVSYDDLGRQSRVLYPQTANGRTDAKQKLYDDLANTVTTVDAVGRKAVEYYDWAGHVTKVVAYGDASIDSAAVQTYSYVYDTLGRKVAFVDPLNQRTEYRYDERDLLVEQRYAEGSGSDRMSYDARGLLIERRDRKGQVVATSYDEAGRAVREDRYASEAAYATHNGAESVQLLLDKRGKPRRVANQDLIERYRYDAKGQLVQLERRITDVSTRLSLASVWSGGEAGQSFQFSYSYNDAGMVTRMTYPDGSVHAFDYDAVLGRLSSIGEGSSASSIAPFVPTFEYNKAGVVTRLGYANGTQQLWQFDARKRISRIQVDGPGAVHIEDLNYTLNGVGDILSINENEYRYDGFDRIAGAKTLNPGCTDLALQVEKHFGTYAAGDPIDGVSYTAAADLNSDQRVNGADYLQALAGSTDTYDNESFSYDQAGNRSKLVQNGDEYSYEYGTGNRLLKVYRKAAGAAAKQLFTEYAYDANGNTISRSVHATGGVQTMLFSYDILNRLVKSERGSQSTEYSYDNAGNRLLKKDSSGALTLYLRHGQVAVAMEVEVAAIGGAQKGEVNRYILSGDLVAGRVSTTIGLDGSRTVAKSYYHLDHLNSTKVVTDASAAVQVRYTYRAFGEQLKRLNGSGAEVGDLATYSYSGKELDEGTNLYYFNARFYDPTTGRFINMDPVQAGGNWYAYCNNNPLSMVDPTGLDSFHATFNPTTKTMTAIYAPSNSTYYDNTRTYQWKATSNITPRDAPTALTSPADASEPRNNYYPQTIPAGTHNLQPSRQRGNDEFGPVSVGTDAQQPVSTYTNLGSVDSPNWEATGVQFDAYYLVHGGGQTETSVPPYADPQTYPHISPQGDNQVEDPTQGCVRMKNRDVVDFARLSDAALDTKGSSTMTVKGDEQIR